MIGNTEAKEDLMDLVDYGALRYFRILVSLRRMSLTARDFGNLSRSIAEKGFDKQYGARPLNRAIQKYIEDALAEEIINSKIAEGDKIEMDYKKGEDELVIKVKKGKNTEEESESKK